MDQSRKRSRHSGAGAQQLQLEDHDDVPVEVMQDIQSRLPVKTAGRTSVLSKSWLHAWSTTPTLRLHHRSRSIRNPNPTALMNFADMDKECTLMQLLDMDHTLMRYLRENIPIETFELIIEIEDQESACLVEKWIRLLEITKTRVKELSLTISRSSILSERVEVRFSLPYEILSIESLTKLRVIADIWRKPSSATMTSSHHHPVIIKCSSLRELHLDGLHISQNILDAILSYCSSSLEKVQLLGCSRYVDTIKVKNLPCLNELSIVTNNGGNFTDFVISHLPNLRVFSLHVFSLMNIRHSFNTHLISLATGSSSVTQLTLEGVIMDTTSLDLIKSGFPFLESLTLDMTSWILGTFHFKCASINSLSLRFCPTTLADVQIHAPKLCVFRFQGYELPATLLFPISATLNQLDLMLQINLRPVDASFFLKMREALTLSSKCHLRIETYFNRLPLDIDIIDLRTRLQLPPATNVQELWFKTDGDKCRWQRSPLFDAFFEICHPNEVLAMPDRTFEHNNHFCKLMLMEVLENNYKNKTRTQTVYWPHFLEHVQFREGLHKNWKTLTNSWRRLIDRRTPYSGMYFKLKWR